MMNTATCVKADEGDGYYGYTAIDGKHVPFLVYE